jgi:hypothetical protein
MNYGVNSYFQFSSFNVDFDLLLVYNMKINDAFLIHCVKLSSLIRKRYILAFSLQHSFICFLILLVNTIGIFHKQKWSTCTINVFNIFLVLNNEIFFKKMKLWNNIIPIFPTRQKLLLNLSIKELLN